VNYAHSTLHRESVFTVIQKSQIMPLILARCLGFQPIWEKYRELWQGEEAGIYNDLAEFAAFIVDAYGRQDTEPIGAAFAAIEELLSEGDEEVAELMTFP